MTLTTLKRRTEFLRVRGGARWSCPGFTLEAKARPVTQTRAEQSTRPAEPRFGFTVTKKLGGAVQRNRIRRRLKEAVRLCAQGRAQPEFDYVLIAREAALTRAFLDLRSDVEKALERVHTREPAAGRDRESRGRGGSAGKGQQPRTPRATNE